MKDEIVYTDEFRKSMWDKFGDLQMKIQFLKGIVQNSMPITPEMLDEFQEYSQDTLQEIFNLSEEIRKEYNQEAKK